MIDIKEYLARILNAVYGEEVRESIHDAIEVCHSEMLTGTEEVQAARIEITAVREEIADARIEIETGRAAVSDTKDYVATAKAEIAVNMEAVTKVEDAITKADLVNKADNVINIYQAIQDMLAEQKYVTVRYFSEDNELLYVGIAPVGGKAIDPVEKGRIPTPTKINHTFWGWTVSGITLTEDRDTYPEFMLNDLDSMALVDRTISGEYMNETVTTVGDYAFCRCAALTAIDLPSATTVGDYAFYECAALTTIDLPSATTINGNYVFYGCTALTTLILRSTEVCSIDSVLLFDNTPIKEGIGYIYVPSALIDAYKTTAGYWTAFANQFRAIEDYPEICGGE